MFHLAQVNIGRLRAPVTDPQIEGFVSRLDEINALAERSPGFVWRLTGYGNNATDIRVFEDPMIAMNLSVWESIETLKDFVYRTMHKELLPPRHQWFERMTTPYMAMWWIPAGTLPTPEEAKARIEHITAHGETAHAFTFRNPFPPPSEETEAAAATTA